MVNTVIEQDYIIRMIKQIIQAILKLVFGIDTDSPTAELLENAKASDTLHRLTEMIDSGNINSAENELYEKISSDNDLDLKVGILFYSYLNDKSDDFLSKNNFSRGEIELGLRNLVSMYGLDDISNLF